MKPYVRALVATALAAAAALPGVSQAAPQTGVTRTLIDGVMVIGYDNPYAARYGVLATRLRYYDSRGVDTQLLCVAFGTRTSSESGCVALTPGPVTEGPVVPTSATIRRRVPVKGRAGGWMDVDLTATATATAPGNPAYAHSSLHRHTIAPGVEATDGGSVALGPSLVRLASVSGTFRNDRGVRFAPVPHPDAYFKPMVYRIEVLTVTAHGGLAAAEAAFGRAAADLLPA